MFGHILALLLGLVLLAFCIAGLFRAGSTRLNRKKPSERPVQGNAPAADEPTPDLSAIATPAEVNAARQHTPPA